MTWQLFGHLSVHSMVWGPCLKIVIVGGEVPWTLFAAGCSAPHVRLSIPNNTQLGRHEPRFGHFLVQSLCPVSLTKFSAAPAADTADATAAAGSEPMNTPSSTVKLNMSRRGPCRAQAVAGGCRGSTGGNFRGALAPCSVKGLLVLTFPKHSAGYQAGKQANTEIF